MKVYYFIDPSKIRFIFNSLIKSVRAIGDYVNVTYIFLLKWTQIKYKAINFALYMFRLAAELFSGEKDFII